MGNKASSRAAATPAEKALAEVFARKSALRPEMFALTPIAHHGLPSNTKTMAFCSRQGILAIGTASGSIKLYGANGLEVLLQAPQSSGSTSPRTAAVVFLHFTAQQRLVATYSDSAIRIFDLVQGGKLHAHIEAT
jgi:hypothetical protein